jgi:hypothetical protein
MPTSSPQRAHGRRIALTGFLAIFVAVLFSTSAFAAGTVTINNTTTGFGADTTAGNPPNRTENRTTTHIDFTVAGSGVADTNSCSLDGALAVACGSSGDGTYSFNAGSVGSPLSLGQHKVVVTNTGGGTATYRWRLEAPQYSPLVLNANPYAYWKLDDAASADTAVDSGPNGYDGDYKNFTVKRQPAGPTCENQPHPPFGCDWSINAVAPPTPGSVDPTPSSIDDPATANPGPGSGLNQGRDRQGYSAYFGGRDDHIQIENMDNPSSGAWTIEAWVKPDFEGESRGIFQHVPSLWTEPGVAAGSTHFACSGLNDEPNAVTSADIPSGSFSGKWYHVACKYSAGTYSLYVNNVRYVSSTSWSPPTSGSYQGFIGLVNSASSWWEGNIDDVAYYDSALSDSTVQWHYETGSITEGKYTSASSDLAPPSLSDISSPGNNAQYSSDAQSYKAPVAVFSCADATPTGSTITSCSVSNDGGPAITTSGVTPLIFTPGVHSIVLTATDSAGLTWKHTHRYYVHQANSGFSDLITCNFAPVAPVPAFPCDGPLAYYRLNDAAGAQTMVDSSGNAFDGEYKNDQDNSGNTGVSGGTPNNTREFFGQGGYAYVNDIAAPLWGYTLEAWWKPADDNGMAILQHGSNGSIWYDGSRVYFRPDERSSAVASIALTNPSASGDWFYVAGSYDGVNATLYLRESTSGNLTLSSASVPAHFQDGAGSADTFYLGFANDVGLSSPWLRGELDEVAYYGTALSSSKLTQHFNADPPAGDVSYAPHHAAASAAGTAAARKAVAKSSVASKAPAKKVSALATARARVASLTRSLARAKAKVKALRKAHAKAATVKKATAKVRSLTSELAKAKAKVKALTPKAKPKAKAKAKKRA